MFQCTKICNDAGGFSVTFDKDSPRIGTKVLGAMQPGDVIAVWCKDADEVRSLRMMCSLQPTRKSHASEAQKYSTKSEPYNGGFVVDVTAM